MSEASVVDLYNRASTASKSSPDNQKDLLVSHINELYQLITEALNDNIMGAANRGSHHAVLAIYKISALHRRIIPIRNMLIPPPGLANKMATLNIQPLATLLSEKLKPFVISIVPVNTLFDLSNVNDLEAVVVKWT